MVYSKDTIVWFQFISGLKITLGKSELVPVGDVPNVDALTRVLRSKVFQLPITYLGLPFGSTIKAKAMWNGVLESMERHLAGWKIV